MFDAMRRDDLYKNNTFLLQDMYDAPEPEETDTRPEWVKLYADTFAQTGGLIDDLIRDKYGAFVFCTDNETPIEAYKQFYKWNIVYTITHNAELGFVYKAFTDKFEPRENYDRYEDTNVNTDMSSGATSKTSPDDNEDFYNVGSADSTTNGDVKTESHIHGNIGVVDAPTMARNVINMFGENGWIEYFIEKLIKENCILIG